MTEIQGSEYLLDRYVTVGPPEPLTKNGVRYTIQRYQGKHKNEYLVRSQKGDVYLYENNILKQQWQENHQGKRSEEFIAYKNGRVHFRQRFEYILEQMNSKRFVYHKKGLRMEIWSAQTGHLLYHGEYNDRQTREGWGIEYDEESGNMVVEGIWSKGRLIEVIRCFKGDTMTELKRNGSDSLDPTKRIPIYVGGFRYDEDNERFVREGVGCLIDEQTGTATRESEWKDGKEVSGVDLYYGWYYTSPLQLTIENSADMANMSLRVTDLTISSDSCNGLISLNLSKFKLLQSICIGDDCFRSVKTFKIDGLNKLKSIKIANNSFAQMNIDDRMDWLRICNPSKSFHILNCESLEFIQIGEFSFSDFAGNFELKNLPQLQSIQIGTIGSESNNFYLSSFVIRGIEMILNIVMIRSSKSTIHYIR